MEIFKTLNVLNPRYMQELFYLRSSSTRWPNNIVVVKTNTTTYGTKRLRSLGPQIWNSLPEHIKAETSFAHFQSLINTWFVKECLCNLCKHTKTLHSITLTTTSYGFLVFLLFFFAAHINSSLFVCLLFFTVLTYVIAISLVKIWFIYILKFRFSSIKTLRYLMYGDAWILFPQSFILRSVS